MDQDLSKQPLPESNSSEYKETQEQELTPEQQRELERTERRNALVQDGLQDLERGLDALNSPLMSALIQEEDSSSMEKGQKEGANNVAQGAGAVASTESGLTQEDSASYVGSVKDQNEVSAGTPVNVDLSLTEVKSIADEYFENFEQLQQNFDGFRIHRVDIYNWSGFNNNVKTVFFGGQNTLMTGDNGAGKSSVIDAITVLLYDLQKITFNQAAGAEKGERNLASYVWGLFKNDNSMGFKTEYGLRSSQPAVLSIISATFYNQTLDEYVVLLQGLSINKQKSSPDRYYYIGNRDFNLQEDVLPVKDTRELSKKLSVLGCERYNSFREYSARMQDLFGIRRTKVLDLFYKTISMKSISNISDFVRKQMLEDFSGEELVDDLIDRVEDLDGAYRAVEESKHQLEELEPIVEKGKAYAQIGERHLFLEECSEGASPYLYKKKADFLQADVKKHQERLEQLHKEQDLNKEKIKDIEQDLKIANQELVAQGGDRQNTIKKQIEQERKDRDRVFKSYTQHASCLQSIGLDVVNTPREFELLPKKLEKLQFELTKSKETYEANQLQISMDLEKFSMRERELSSEVQSLRTRKNNIPFTHVRVREQICNAIGCDERDLPFVGELIQIKDSEKVVWERAIEKVLHNYAISLLVTEDYYSDVVHYVNTHDIGMRLVFNRIKERDLQSSQSSSLSNAFGSRMSTIQQVGSNSLVRKLEFKQDPRFQGYLRQFLERNFNYVCTTSEQEYRSEATALMPSGLCKKGARNEKDDRRKSNNDFVLGWTNEEKLASLMQELSRVKVDTDSCRNNLRTIKEGLSTVGNKIVLIDRLREISSFSQIDVKTHDDILEKLHAELLEIQRTSDIIATLSKKIQELEHDKAELEAHQLITTAEYGKYQSRLEIDMREFKAASDMCTTVNTLKPEVVAELDRCIEDAMRVLHFIELDAGKIESLVHEVTEKFKGRLNELRTHESNLASELVNLQTRFASKYITLSRNLDSNRASAWVDFNTIYEKIKADDLPKYLDAFRHKLSTDTLDQFATLNAKFSSDRRAIEERIAQINEIMYEVDFNPNHYIRMVATDSKDLEIQQFRNDLKKCTRGSLEGFGFDAENQNTSVDEDSDDNQSTKQSSLDFSSFDFEKAEQKFLEVKALIDRLKGRSDSMDLDLKWRRKVTDVKQWFEFTASEHSREDDSQVDYYEDSGGKSGGQKEKLAYTVLASSIAYQYKSRQLRSNDRSFRFVVIDEAFGRSSPQSVDYALTLFDKFNLQLLVATPMQKLDVIEKFVNHVAFVFRNELTNESTILNYELKDYILKRKLKEEINKARALGKDKEANIILPSSKGDVALNANQVEKIVNELDDLIKSEQVRYTGPTHDKSDNGLKAKVKVDAEGNLIGSVCKSRAKSKAVETEQESLQSSTNEARHASDEQANFDKLQETQSLMSLVKKDIGELKAQFIPDDNAQAPSEIVTSAEPSEIDQGIAADSLATTRGVGLNTRNEYGQYMSIDEYRKRQDQERRQTQKQELAEAFDKLMELEKYDVSQHASLKKAEPQGEIIKLDEEPVDFSRLASSKGFDNDSDAEQGDELVIDAKSIQRENRSIKKWSKGMVDSNLNNKYKADPDAQIKPSRSLGELFGATDDDGDED